MAGRVSIDASRDSTSVSTASYRSRLETTIAGSLPKPSWLAEPLQL